MGLFIVLIFLEATIATGFLAMDGIRGNIPRSTFECLQSNGARYYISRVVDQYGNIDQDVVTSLKHASGMSRIDVYFIPCKHDCGIDIKQQACNTVNTLRRFNIDFNRIWIQVVMWEWDYAQKDVNRKIIMDLAGQLKAMKVKIGIYTNSADWDSIMGNTWNGVAQYPLWWNSVSSNANLNGFTPFGGWIKPNMRQYKKNANETCSIGLVNIDYFEDLDF